MITTAAGDPDVLAFESTVEAIDGAAVALEESYFYPEGGGQPADRGTIDGVEVIDVQAEAETVWHDLATTPSFEAGAVVEATIDPAFRTYCKRAHTASHVLFGAGRRVCADLGYGGFDIDAERVRVDLRTPTVVDDSTLVALERLANRAVWDSLDVTWETLPADQALEREDIAFNTATEEGLAGQVVRIVTIEDWDVAACGGTHVRNTREIGPIAVRSRSNPGEGLTRIEFAVGPPAIRHRAAERRRSMQAAARLETAVEDLPAAVDRLLGERDDLEAERNALRADLLEDRLATLRDEPVERNGSTWIVGSLPTADANILADKARATVNAADVDVAALVSDDGAYLAVATAGEADATSIVETVTASFGGGGGGSATVAQGGGLDAAAGEVVAFLRG